MFDQCKQCGGVTFEERQKGPHIGLYCVACDTHLRWIKRPENIDDGTPASAEQNRLAYRLMDRYLQVRPHLTAKQAGSIIQWLNIKKK